MYHLLYGSGGQIAKHPVLKMWEGRERALLAYQQAMCYEWSSVRGNADNCWDKTRLMFLDVIFDPMTTPLIPPIWMGNVDLHISHQSVLLRIDESHYRKFFPGIRTDHDYIWPVESLSGGENWWDEECIRAGGEVICEICRRPYWRHRQVAKKEVPTLVRACDGRLLKL